MKDRKKAATGAALGLVLICPILAQAQGLKATCGENSRTRMIAAAQSYLKGIVHHDGSHVLFAPDVRRTEQGHDTGQGEAILRATLARMPPMLAKGAGF